MTEELDGTNLVEEQNSASWDLEPNRTNPSHSVYVKLCQGQEFEPAQDMWKATVPQKIKFFVWQLIRGRLPSNDQVLKRRGPSDGKCSMCGQPKDVEHIFFGCV